MSEQKPLAQATGSALPPTHKCRVCGALWRVNLQRDTAEDESWRLVSKECFPCCDNAFMGEQLVPLTADDLMEWLDQPNHELTDATKGGPNA